MYELSDLISQPYFDRVLKGASLSTVLDSLTGVVSRCYMIEYIRTLLDQKAEFTVGMIDLDNFKSYNDHYGHSVGDQVLQHVGATLSAYVGSRGVVGRFGGDEFLIVAFVGNDYQKVHDFYESMYNQGNVYSQQAVFRRDIQIGPLKLFLSATLGSASVPKDAQDYATLFSLIDKTLYRGKNKGRNCYIIYVPEKHAHLEIPSLARHSLYDTFMEMAAAFDGETELRERLYRTYLVMHKYMHFHFFFYIDPERRVLDVEKNQVIGDCEDLSPLISDGFFSCSARNELKDYPRLEALMKPYIIHSVLLLSIGPTEENHGYLLLSPEPKTLHIWQDEELAAGFVLVRLVREVIGK